MKKVMNYFIIWGGVVVSSLIFEVLLSGKYLIIVDAVLLGIGIGFSFVNAIGKDVVEIDNFKDKHKNLAVMLDFLGKVDSVISLIVLPVIGMAFMESMGWGDVRVNHKYLEFVAVGLVCLWGCCLVIGVWKIWGNFKKK